MIFCVQFIQKGDKFKVLIVNLVECYIYVFGQEMDGFSYVFFLYMFKYLVYCGVIGICFFLWDYFMVVDKVGS